MQLNEGRISELEDRSTENIQGKEQRKNTGKKKSHKPIIWYQTV